MSIRMYKFFIILYVVLPLAATVFSIWLLWNRAVFATDLILLGSLYIITGLGITIGYHRMLTHRGFDAPEWLRGLILICGAAAFEWGPVSWAGRHVEHHAHSDEEEDPHSPLHGFWHAHVGWIYSIGGVKPNIKKYAPHLLEDKTAMFVEKYTLLWMALFFLIPFLIGGWTGMLWGGAVRVFLVTHMTWSVNSVCHTFGRRDFETTDESRNNWVVGLLGAGEGWHNNHHAFPDSAIHGLRWWQVDFSGYIIRAMELVGLVWNVRRIPKETQEAHAERSAAVQAARQVVLEELEQNMNQAEQELQAMKKSGTPEVDGALKRLKVIRRQVAIAPNLKKQKLREYIQEIAERVQRCKMSLA